MREQKLGCLEKRVAEPPTRVRFADCCCNQATTLIDPSHVPDLLRRFSRLNVRCCKSARSRAIPVTRRERVCQNLNHQIVVFLILFLVLAETVCRDIWDRGPRFRSVGSALLARQRLRPSRHNLMIALHSQGPISAFVGATAICTNFEDVLLLKISVLVHAEC